MANPCFHRSLCKLQSVVIVLTACCLVGGLNSQNIENKEATVKNTAPGQNDEPGGSQKDGAAGENPSASNLAETPGENKTEVAQPVPAYTNPAMQARVNEQYRWTPEDPSFLYETRNIPDHKNNQEFLPAELEKVEVKEQIKDEINFRKSLGKIKIRLPDMTQTLVLVTIIIVVLVYRSRVRKHHDPKR